MNEQKYKYFPLYVRMEDAHILIFGAGVIAARRVAALAKTPCRLTIIAPECSEQMQELLDQWQDRITYVNDRYHPGCLMEEDMDAVIAATDDPAVNEAIYRECRHREIHVNVATDHTLCSFYFPATVEVPDSELLIAIASGKANAQTHQHVRRLREQIEQGFGKKYE